MRASVLISLEDRFAEQERIYGLHVARILAVKELRSQGWSLREIGRALGLSHERIRQLGNETVNLQVDA